MTEAERIQIIIKLKQAEIERVAEQAHERIHALTHQIDILKRSYHE